MRPAGAMGSSSCPRLSAVSDLLALPWTEARGAVSPREYVDACLRAIEQHNGTLNAFLHVNAEAPAGTLPIAAKDNIVTTDMPATCGSRILAGFRSPFDATAIARLRSA